MGRRTRTVVLLGALSVLSTLGAAAVGAGFLSGTDGDQFEVAVPVVEARPVSVAREADVVPIEEPSLGSLAPATATTGAARANAGQVDAGQVDAGQVDAGQVDATAGWLEPAGPIDQVVLVGDSLAQEVTPMLRVLTPGTSFVPKFWGGTAPCDWLGVDLQATPSSVVVITFTGNTLTDCMGDGQGGHLIDDALVARYREDIAVLIDSARRSGARVVLVGQPLRAPSFDADLEVNGINAVYQEYAAAHPFVSFVDAGAAVETPDGLFAERLPCTPYDTDCAADGTTVVRGDGVHFCPIVGENPCSIWASGAFRFALAIASAANDPAAFD